MVTQLTKDRIRKTIYYLVFSCLLFSFKGTEKYDLTLESKYPIIPTPQLIKYGHNEIYFKNVSIIAEVFPEEGRKLQKFLIDKGTAIADDGLKIVIKKGEISGTDNSESYQLKIDQKKVTITANTSKGAFYGVQSLRQLFRVRNGQGILPEAEIKDWPAFKIRGFMHDTGRNFQSTAQLKEQIEILAQYKYNIFHWHLTDNPGWRLESKLYPQLQDTAVTSREKGKFYSQEDFKEILAFCKERHITVIPELDIPGHTEVFRKAFKIETMRDKKVAPILNDLFNELCDLADEDEMPYIHIGTDEVKSRIESVNHEVIFNLMDLLQKRNREVIVWKEGIVIKKDSTSINQLWAQHKGRKGHRFIDSRSNYINHLDPFAGMARLFFQQPCRQVNGDELALGGILCAWPDNNVGTERDILKQNPIYPSMVFYADAIWKGRAKDYPEYWAKLPSKNKVELEWFRKFEKKVIVHRNEFFKGKDFQYVEQSNIEWNLIGPFVHNGDFLKSFPVEDGLKEEYVVDGETYKWTDNHIGATIHIKHFFGFQSPTKEKEGTYYAYSEIYSPDNREQDFWIGFQGWSRSSRRGGPTPSWGQWHTTFPKIWVNNKEIFPPEWQQPNLGVNSSEIPYLDEDYFYRKPTKVELRKGWNKILLKIPHGEPSWKWMFTCVPINIDQQEVKEVLDLKFSPDFNNKLSEYEKI